MMNFSFADRISDRQEHIETIEKTRVLKCTPDYLSFLKDISRFECYTKIKGENIAHFVTFYQLKGYDRSLWDDDRGYVVNQQLRDYYSDGDQINLRSIDNRSTQALIDLIGDKEVTIQINDSSKIMHSDQYIWLTGTVYVDDLDVGLELIKKGFAWASPPEWESNPVYDKAQAIAKEQSLGYWENTNTASPWQIEENHKSLSQAIRDEEEAQNKSEYKNNVILFSFILVVIGLGFIGVLALTMYLKSPTTVFTLVIPYILIGGNLALIASSLYEDRNIYMIILLPRTLTISGISIVLGIIMCLLKVRKK